MVWCRANRPQQYIRTPKEATMEVIKLEILRAKEPIVKRTEAKPRILAKEDI